MGGPGLRLRVLPVSIVLVEHPEQVLEVGDLGVGGLGQEVAHALVRRLDEHLNNSNRQ